VAPAFTSIWLCGVQLALWPTHGLSQAWCLVLGLQALTVAPTNWLAELSLGKGGVVPRHMFWGSSVSNGCRGSRGVSTLFLTVWLTAAGAYAGADTTWARKHLFTAGALLYLVGALLYLPVVALATYCRTCVLCKAGCELTGLILFMYVLNSYVS
jgi:hypothetical protein